MYKLEIETKNRLKRIRNPRKARAKDLIVRAIVEVMDENSKWHFIGHCFYEVDAEWAADDINDAIKAKEKTIDVSYLLS